MKIAVNKSVQENILNLIKDSNPGASAVTLDKITIGAVSALTGDVSGKNSRVTITAVPNAGFSKSVTLKFNRLPVTSGVATLPTAISILPGDSQAQRITKVATALGLIESEITVTGVGGGTLGTPANEDDTTVSVVVTPKANSSLYVGSSLTIQLTTPDVDVDLNSIITNTTLNGFEPVT